MASSSFTFCSNETGISYTWVYGGQTYKSPDTYYSNVDGSLYADSGTTVRSLTNTTITLSEPLPTGFRFNGWYTLASNSTKGIYQLKRSDLAGSPLSTNKSISISSNTLKTWTGSSKYGFLCAIVDNTYSITFDTTGGSGGTQNISAIYGQPMPQITVPTRTGYTFAGYYDTDASVGGTQYYTASGSSARNWDKSIDATLYARWIGNELICTYNPNGGFSDRYFDRVRAGGTFPALPTATWGGDTTSRWYTAKTGGTEVHQGDTVTQTEDFTLYAHWSIPVNTHTLTLNANGGTVSPASRTLAEGAAYGTLPTPTRSGYTFVEWRTAPYVGTLVTSSTKMGADDVTIYAIWTGNPFTITLNANGGTVTPATKSVPNGSTYGILPRPTRSGFIFDGWWTAATGGTKILATAKPSGTQTVYAHWKQDGGEVVHWVF